MTTKITVDAHAGWPVRVTKRFRNILGLYDRQEVEIVNPGGVREYFIHGDMKLETEEVQPGQQGEPK